MDTQTRRVLENLTRRIEQLNQRTRSQPTSSPRKRSPSHSAKSNSAQRTPSLTIRMPLATPSARTGRSSSASTTKTSGDTHNAALKTSLSGLEKSIHDLQRNLFDSSDAESHDSASSTSKQKKRKIKSSSASSSTSTASKLDARPPSLPTAPHATSSLPHTVSAPQAPPSIHHAPAMTQQSPAALHTHAQSMELAGAQNSVRQLLQEVRETERREMHERFMQQEAQIDVLNQQVSQMQNKLAEAHAISEGVSSLAIMLQDLEDHVDLLENHKEELARSAKGYEEENKKLSLDLERLSSENRSLHKQCGQLEQERNQLASTCRETQLALDRTDAELVAEIAKLKIERDSDRTTFERKIAKLENVAEAERTLRSKFEEGLSSVQRDKASLLDERARLEGERSKLLHELETMRARQAEKTEELHRLRLTSQVGEDQREAMLEDMHRARRNLEQRLEIAEREAKDALLVVSRKDAMIEELERSRRLLEEKVNDYTKRSEEESRLRQMVEEGQRIRAALEQKLEEYQRRVEESVVTRRVLEDRLDELQKGRKTLEDRLNVEQQNHREALLALERSDAMLEELQKSKKTAESKLETEIKEHEEALKAWERRQRKQEEDAEHRRNADVAEYRERIRTLSLSIQEKDAEILSLRQKLQDDQDQVTGLKQEASQAQQLMSQMQTQMQQLQQQQQHHQQHVSYGNVPQQTSYSLREQVQQEVHRAVRSLSPQPPAQPSPGSTEIVGGHRGTSLYDDDVADKVSELSVEMRRLRNRMDAELQVERELHENKLKEREREMSRQREQIVAMTQELSRLQRERLHSLNSLMSPSPLLGLSNSSSSYGYGSTPASKTELPPAPTAAPKSVSSNTSSNVRFASSLSSPLRTSKYL